MQRKVCSYCLQLVSSAILGGGVEWRVLCVAAAVPAAAVHAADSSSALPAPALSYTAVL